MKKNKTTESELAVIIGIADKIESYFEDLKERHLQSHNVTYDAAVCEVIDKILELTGADTELVRKVLRELTSRGYPANAGGVKNEL